jgi:hypothetical protein
MSATLKNEKGLDVEERLVESRDAVVTRVDSRNGEDEHPPEDKPDPA